MGFFDDLASIAKEYNSIKSDVVSSIDEVKKEVTSIKTDAKSTVTKIKQQITPDDKKPPKGIKPS